MDSSYITVIGSINYDIIFKQQRLPARGETYTADSVFFASGGKGANQAVQAAKLGAKTYLVGRVGRDNFGDYLTEAIKGYGVDTSYIRRSDMNTGIGVDNILHDGGLYATISTGANYDLNKNDIDAIDELIRKSKIVVLQLEIPTELVEYIIEKANSYGVYIVLNAAPAKSMSSESLKKVDCLVVNEPEASFYTNADIRDADTVSEQYEKILNLVKDIVIITLGANGSVLCEKTGCTVIKPSGNVTVADTVGAGDSYIGAYCYQKLIGKTNIEACQFASRAAELTVSNMGAQPAMPDLEKLLQALL